MDRVTHPWPASGLGVLMVDYEIDYVTAPRMRAAICDGFAPGVRGLVVDLTRCTFVDTAGLSELIAAHQRLAAADALLAVVVPATLSRVFAITSLDRYLRVFPTLTAAREALD